jgi:Bacterial toxin 46
MPPAARLTDQTTHGTPLAPGPGSVDVLIGNMPAWRTMIDQHACPAVSVSGADGVGSVMMGSPTVQIDFQMACRVMDIVVEKPGLAMGPVNPIVMGCMTVMIGEMGMGGMMSPIAPEMIAAKAAGASLVSMPKSAAPPAAPAPAEPPPSMAIVLDNVSAEQIALAATPGIGASQIAARESVAKAFYQKYTKDDDGKPWTPERIRAHLKGIDFAKPVSAALTPPPSQVVSFRVPGQKGNYFADPGTLPTQLGIGNLGIDQNLKTLVEKKATQYVVQPGTAYLQTTAKKVVDTWSVPLNNVCPSPLKEQGLPQITQGGGKQYFIAAENACKQSAADTANHAANNAINQWQKS